MKPGGETRRSKQGRPGNFIDRTRTTTRALVIVPYSSKVKTDEQRPGGRSPQARLDEAVNLAQAIGHVTVVEQGLVPLTTIRPATLIGKGKVEELVGQIAALDIGLVIVDHPLSPVQQKNLELAWHTKVIDRTALILEIFGERARTKEGRLQVELAHLNYQKGRLVRSWTHLERQRGGGGFLGGPGETQIEADRRQIQDQIGRLEKDLEQVRRTRLLHRKARKKVPHPVVALVGYTNAGKSTLFNTLTQADVRAEDQLFATLDPTLRRVLLPHGAPIVLSDTVGFISDLPTHLVAAFRATLEEVVEADIILHVRDAADADREAQAADVAATLRMLDINPDDGSRIIEVFNKIDLLDDAERQRLRIGGRAANGAPISVAVSALTGAGTDLLLARVEELLTAGRPVHPVSLSLADGAGLAWLYNNTEVLERRDGDVGIDLRVRVADKVLAEFRRRYLNGRAPNS